jgi:hypothetical protein
MKDSLVHLIEEDLSNLDDVLRYYDKQLHDYKDKVKIDLKSYAQANGEQPAWLAFYGEIVGELEVLEDDLKMRWLASKGEALKSILRNSNREYTEKQLLMMVDASDKVSASYKAMREITERRKKAENILNAFDKRGHALRNLVNCRAGEFQYEKIYVNE